jgi:ABC-type nickel/cobalt efflux system permease component RcnA
MGLFNCSVEQMSAVDRQGVLVEAKGGEAVDHVIGRSYQSSRSGVYIEYEYEHGHEHEHEVERGHEHEQEHGH